MSNVIVFSVVFFCQETCQPLRVWTLNRTRRICSWRIDPVLMPLPDAGADGPLDWAHLVDAAKAFEGRHMSEFHFFLKRING